LKTPESLKTDESLE
jgi:hypothetical protein